MTGKYNFFITDFLERWTGYTLFGMLTFYVSFEFRFMEYRISAEIAKNKSITLTELSRIVTPLAPEEQSAIVWWVADCVNLREFNNRLSLVQIHLALGADLRVKPWKSLMGIDDDG